MLNSLVLYTCIYINIYFLIFENLDVGDVFAVIVPPGNAGHVAYFLMRYTQIKTRLVCPYVDREFTYQVGNLVVMGHLFKKVRRSGQYSHLVVAAWIHLIEMKVKRGEPKRWKMLVVDHDCIMETCIPITHLSDD